MNSAIVGRIVSAFASTIATDASETRFNDRRAPERLHFAEIALLLSYAFGSLSSWTRPINAFALFSILSRK